LENVVSLQPVIIKKLKIMALETRPFPELSGQALIDFLEKVKNFKDDTPREKMIEGLRWVRRETAKQQKRLEDAESEKGL
jgi:hypothetical protein